MEKTSYKIRNVLMVLVAVALIFTTVPGTAFAAKKAPAAVSVNLKADGTTVKGAVKVGNAVLVSKDVLTKYFGATVSASKKKMTVKMTSETLTFNMGSKKYNVSGKEKSGSKSQVVKNKPMIPIKDFVQSMGGTYKLKGKTCTVTYFKAIKGKVKISGSSTLYPCVSAAASKLRKINADAAPVVTMSDSGNGIKDAIAGRSNLGMSSRELKPAEKSKVSGVVSVARDGIAIIVNPKNKKVSKLTKKQAADIFLGKITNWKQVGGDNAAIKVMTREVGSGTRASLEEMLLDKASVKKNATVYKSSGLIKRAVADSKYAIGFDSIGFVDKTVKAVTYDGVKPSKDTVKSGKYSMSRSLFLIYTGTPTKAAAMFIDYMKTSAVQNSCVLNKGYINII